MVFSFPTTQKPLTGWTGYTGYFYPAHPAHPVKMVLLLPYQLKTFNRMDRIHRIFISCPSYENGFAPSLPGSFTGMDE
jgi:hypothetical protein